MNDGFKHVEYGKLTTEQHAQYLVNVVTDFMNLCDDATFRAVFAYAKTDYLMQLYANLKDRRVVK